MVYSKKVTVSIFLLFFLFIPTSSEAISHEFRNEYVPISVVPGVLEGQSPEGELPQVPDLKDYLFRLFAFSIAIAAAIAVVQISWGGIEYMISETPFGKANGKDRVWAAIQGLLLLLATYLILNQINPKIFSFELFSREQTVESVPPTSGIPEGLPTSPPSAN